MKIRVRLYRKLQAGHGLQRLDAAGGSMIGFNRAQLAVLLADMIDRDEAGINGKITDLADTAAAAAVTAADIPGQISSAIAAEDVAGQIADAIAPVAADLTALEATVAGHTTQIGALESDVTAHGTAITALQSDVSALETSVSAHGSAITALQSDVSALETAVAALETNFADHETRIAALEAIDVPALIAADIAAIPTADLDTCDGTVTVLVPAA